MTYEKSIIERVIKMTDGQRKKLWETLGQSEFSITTLTANSDWPEVLKDIMSEVFTQ